LTELSFLIDECLTPDLCEIARGRGYHALHATWAKLGSQKDSKVAKYALDHDMILVTNNLVDFDKIYRRKPLHPGVIFLMAEDELMDYESQTIMFMHALDSADGNEPINEAIRANLFADIDQNLVIEIARYELAKKPRSLAA
jgi:predicted nuclease of predicted toxin-antitoxin system